MKSGYQIAVLLGIALAAPAFAQQPVDDHSAHHAGAKAPSAAMSDGEIRKVDKAAKKLTIKHGPLVNLDMPAMTMVFRVKDPAMLDQVKTGDKVRFAAESIGGQLTVTKVELAK